MRLNLAACRSAIRSVEDASHLPDDWQKDEYLQERVQEMVATTEKLYLALTMLYEHLQFGEALASLKASYDEVRALASKTEHYADDPDLPLFNPVVERLENYIDLIAPVAAPPASGRTERAVLWRILRQTARVIELGGVLPKREKDVQDALEKVLQVAFPEVIREAIVLKQSKTYQPDFGFESLATAVEIKYARKKADIGKVLGELGEDMLGYAGAPAYTTFLAVIYATGHFSSQERIEAELKTSKVSKNWKVVLVVGPGPSDDIGSPSQVE